MADTVITGTVHRVGETGTYGQKGFRKRELVIARDDGRYTDYVPIEFIQDGCLQLDGVNPGDTVRVEVTLKGRLWEKTPDDVRCFGSNLAGQFKVLNSVGGGQQTMDTSSSQAGFDEDNVPF